MTEILKPQHKEFADKFIDTNNATLAAQEAFDIEDPNYAGVRGHKTLRMAKVREYIEGKAEIAASVVFEIAVAGENDTVKLKASQDILDRAGLKPTEKTFNTTVSVELKPTPRIEALATQLNESLRK